MTFRRRIGVLAGGAVAVAFLLASVIAYVTIERSLERQVDRSLGARGLQFLDRSPAVGAPLRAERLRRFAGNAARAGPAFDYSVTYVPPDGPPVAVLPPPGGGSLPVDARVKEVTAGRSGSYLADVRAGSEPTRLRVTPVSGGGALLVGRSLAEVHAVMDRVRLILVLVALGGVGVAALLGRFVAGRAIAPLAALTGAAERVAATRDLSHRISVVGSDEIARLAVRFNAMLDALEAAMRSQRQLIADASHELRTPVTSLRTNLEILQSNPALDPDRRAVLVERASAQTAELSALMADLLQLARGDEPETSLEPVRLDELVEEALERLALNAPGQSVSSSLDETVVRGAPALLSRAVNNLFDNAAHYGAGGPIAVTLRGGELRVRDHGPGFDEAELPFVFDRFFRGAASRGVPGSGLGLAIVRQVAESHGGSLSASNVADGGAELVLRLPTAAPAPAPPSTAQRHTGSPGRSGSRPGTGTAARRTCA